MNPAIAKLTPWLMEAMADTLAESGMLVSGITVDAMSSWTQFYKNIPMALAIFIFITGNAFIKEYQSGTLVQMLTGGLTRGKVFASKTLVISCMWSVCYWLCFFITYAYNAYFWDNGAALNLFFSAFCFYLFGLLIVSLTVLMSVCFSSAGAVFAGTGGIVVCVYFLNTVPVIARYLPARLRIR